MENDQSSEEHASSSRSSLLSRRDYEDFLVHVYFPMGLPGEGFMEGCINRAYLDFNRTLHGLSKVPLQEELHDRAKCALASALEELKGICLEAITQSKFDQLHEITCRSLINEYAGFKFKLYVGQAQKWINMALKYIFVLGEDRVPGFSNAYRFCHVPIDNILLDQLTNGKYKFPDLPRPWSQIESYDSYLEFQKWMRNSFPLLPLDIEFKLWMHQEMPRKDGV